MIISDILTYFILGMLGIILLAIILVRPDYGLTITIASLPLYVFTDLPRGFRFTSVTGILGGLTLLSSIWQLRTNPRHDSLRQKNPGKINRNFYLLVFLLIIEIAVWDFLVPVHVRFFTFTYLQVLILVWLAEHLLKDLPKIETLMKVFIGVTLLSLVISLQDFDFFVPGGSSNLRLSGLAGNANEFAIYVGVAIIFLFYFYEISGRRVIKMVALGLSLLGFIPVFLSGSRGGFLFLILTLVYQLYRFKSRSTFLILFLFLTLLFNSTLVGREYIERIIEIPRDLLTQGDTIGLRIELWLYALELWRTSPVWGIGTGMFLINSINSPVMAGRKMLVAHSAYITHLSENGLVGLALFLLIIGKAVQNYEKTIRTYRDKNLRLTKLAITWESVLLIYALNSLKGNLNTAKIFWLSFGISLALNRFRYSRVSDSSQSEEIYAKPELLAGVPERSQ